MNSGALQMSVRPSRVVGVVGAVALLTSLAIPSASAQVIDAAPLIDATPGWAKPEAKVGQADAGQRRRVQIALQLRDKRGAEALAKAVSTPGSAQHGKYLSPGQFVERFGPAQATVDKVSTWLRSKGLAVKDVTSNRHFISVEASNGQLEAAFGTSLSSYKRKAKDGREHILVAPERALTLPRELAGVVTAVVGIDDNAKTVTPNQVSMRAVPGRPGRPLTAAAPGQECAPHWGAVNNTAVPQMHPAGQQSNDICGYNASQIRAIYGLTAANTGAGQHIAITGAYNLPSLVSDTDRAGRTYGWPALTAGQYTAKVAPTFDSENECGGVESWHAEQALDVQAIRAFSPAAKITYYGAQSCFELYSGLNQAVADNTASVVTNSWLFEYEADIPASDREQVDAIALQAAIQGQAVLFCSGDQGDNSRINGRPEASWPAIHPWVTAVGGTTVALGGDNKLKFTAGWQHSGFTQNGNQWAAQQDSDGRFAGGAGGGVSMRYPAPDYQKNVVPTSISQGRRAMPDISAIADALTGMGIGHTRPDGVYELYPSGGTSLASPVMAALVANAQQTQGVARFGFLNPAIYKLKGNAAITDVTPVKAGIWAPYMIQWRNVDVPTQANSYLVNVDDKPQTLVSATGWDNVTGIGTPASNGAFLTALGK
ncbi:subtilase family protein [Lentzea flaviverrucosa]|uniref:Subtilase family protein n=1 Tax=Lentzea flaviverrucosa TaxID=200379 RepID=A0A1H9ETU2_9PSEU|nr:subtilase family protein [Lentzea flaviverrucosa]SEQ29007.1 Subtilase family protein [Lentzea flaviverrucosa]